MKIKPLSLGQGNITITNPGANTSFPAGVQQNANGTYANGWHVSSLSFIYQDAGGNTQTQQLQVTQNAGNWSTTFTLPNKNWEYLFCARAGNLSGQTDYADNHITGT